MNKRLDDLFNEADSQLQELETESRKKDLAELSSQEVDSETALKFNQSAIGKESYAARHPITVKLGSIALLLLLATQIYTGLMAPRATGPYHLVTGTVRSSSIVWSGRFHYGSVATAKVVLPDGRIVTLRIDSGTLLRADTPLAIRVYDTGAIVPDRLL